MPALCFSKSVSRYVGVAVDHYVDHELWVVVKHQAICAHASCCCFMQHLHKPVAVSLLCFCFVFMIRCQYHVLKCANALSMHVCPCLTTVVWKSNWKRHSRHEGRLEGIVRTESFYTYPFPLLRANVKRTLVRIVLSDCGKGCKVMWCVIIEFAEHGWLICSQAVNMWKADSRWSPLAFYDSRNFRQCCCASHGQKAF